MRLLVVGMAESVHTARWLDQIADQGWDVHVFPSQGAVAHPGLRNVTVHALDLRQRGMSRIRQPGAVPSPFPTGGIMETAARAMLGRARRSLSGGHAGRLARLVRRLRPDLVHSLEIQRAGYLTLDAAQRSNGLLPSWIVTNWGSDIFLFGRLPKHAERIRAVLAACDFYSCECRRDVQLARDMGFRGEVLPVMPNSGGFNLDAVARFRSNGAVSDRRLILLKGYQHWAGRGLVGVRALALCADALRKGGYRVAIIVPSPEVELAAELMSQDTGVPVEMIPFRPHDDILRLYGQARIYVGLSLSDAISTSLLEAMVMGAFPIQSGTACADEWIENGRSGFIVPPEDPEAVAVAIRRALQADDLVNRAAEINAVTARDRLDASVLAPQAVAMYEHALASSRSRAADPGARA